MLDQFFPHRINYGRFTSRDGEPTEKSGSSFIFATYPGPLVVLIDRPTASAAEIFAHVVQHYKRATIVGRRTAGWVLVSFNYGLSDGGRLQIPEKDYVGLDGQRLEGRGVTPDVVVPSPSLTDLRAGRDPDVEAALSLLRQSAPSPGDG
jgi:carboxyl-terminal processing protease